MISSSSKRNFIKILSETLRRTTAYVRLLRQQKVRKEAWLCLN